MSRVDVHRFGIGAARNRRRVAGLTLVEVMCAVALLLILATIAMPLARNTVQRHKEAELRRDLNVICAAIDRCHQYASTGAIKPWDPDWQAYPPDLETRVERVEITGTATGGRRWVGDVIR